MQDDISNSALQVLDAWRLGGASLQPLAVGLINHTFMVEAAGAQFVLQRVNPIFGPTVNDDIDAITTHLESVGITTPRLVRTTQGALTQRDNSNGLWRVLTYVHGITHTQAVSPELCKSAGALVARFHAALQDFSYTFKHRRAHVHDTPRHLLHLEEALRVHHEHRAFDVVQPLAQEILAHAHALPTLTAVPERIVHGDLKLTNILFTPSGEALALVDLDTLAPMGLHLELGDAWRSWCNPRGEDAANCHFELGHLQAALAGYSPTAKSFITQQEIAALPYATLTIALELAARFCADALNESYFGWDRNRFGSASAHNTARAQAQLQLARSLVEQQDAIATLVHTAFNGGS